MSNQEELQKIAYEVDYYRQQADGIQQRMGQIQGLVSESEATLNALGSLNGDTLMPLGSGAFAKVAISDPQKVLLEVGGRVLVEKTVAEAKALVETRKSELQKALDELNRAMDKISKRVSELDEQAVKLQTGE